MISLNLVLSVLAALETAQAVRFLGRVNPATQELTWSGTGVSFTFQGTTASIELAAVTGENSAYLVVDGKSTYIENVSGTTISTPAGLAAGNHSVEFRKSSEAVFGSIWLGDITTDGALGPDTPAPARKIEVIGDSITAGYGIGDLLPCVNTPALEHLDKTYSVLTANALNAEYNILAWSGKGVTRNYVSEGDANPIMPEYYSRWGANDADGSYTFPSSWTPDAVVINLGTNDFSYLGSAPNGSTVALRPQLDAAAFTAGVVDFVHSIEKHYPDAKFFLLTSPMLNDGYPSVEEAQKSTQTKALKDAIALLEGTPAYLVDWPSQGEEVGCDYHPTPATNEVGAKLLTAAIREVLGW